MRFGLLADIHGDVGTLQRAIDALDAAGVDKFVVLGDVIYDIRGATETVDLLKARAAVGVWGNHDLGLCDGPDEFIRTRFSSDVIEFFRTLDSKYEHGDALFSHTFPNQDATDPVAYYLGPRLDDDRAVAETLAAFSHRRIFIGHFHQWFVGTSSGTVDWHGEHPIRLEPSTRYVIVVHAVMNGWAAIYDDSQDVLIPVQL